jgi:hypothetical protein
MDNQLKPHNDPNRRIEVRANGHGIIFVYDPHKDQIEVRRGEEMFVIPLWMLKEFARVSQRNVYQVYINELSCGHFAGTRKNEDGVWVCVICGE